ncbi:LutC/YkgG family protein [Rubinisphaera margarita]|uniref:LutC/YkgG family protein n=1 Tax=Rubinisphaera margarita TaxID=2909586 RepID=UPI001EE7E4EF|nr:LUD domain-containing protein [Rubinisphaera margarita]MCG6156059.1 lactate utilization protein [Rubinisphaera margarita]
MTSSRDEILAALKKNKPDAAPLPDLNKDWIQYEDRVKHFSAVLETVGGKAFEVAGPEDAQQELQKLIDEISARKIYSQVPDLQASNFDVSAIKGPHEFEDVDLALFHGQIGVAENAAVWLDEAALRDRVVLFIAQHVLLTVRRDDIVNNMHEAYDRLTWDVRQFGVFVSGPSKTADIEQSLVIGAHGARSMTVFITE